MSKLEKKTTFIKNLMLGLIYPAILGNMIFLIFSYSSSTDSLYFVKYFLLIATTFLYIFDYINSYFVDIYNWRRFLFNLFFIFNLYYTIYQIHIPADINGKYHEPHFVQFILSFSFYSAYLFNWQLWTAILDKDKSNKKKYSEDNIWNFERIFCVVSVSLLFIKMGFMSLTISQSSNSFDFFTILIISFIVLGYSIITFLKYKRWMDK